MIMFETTYYVNDKIIFLLTLQFQGPNDIPVIFEVKRIFAK